MKSMKVMSATVLLLVFGMSAAANALQEKPKEESRPPKQEQQARPEKQQQSQAPKQQQEHQQHQAQAPKRQQQARPEKQQQAQAPKQQNNSAKQQQQANASQQQHSQGQRSQQNNSEKQQQQARTPQHQQPREQQARSSQAPQRTQQAVARQRSQPALRLSARGRGRIPDDRFRSHFGREHAFRVGTPVLVGGYSRFQYGGFWFGFVEPWPEGWYYTDDVYIDYVDGDYYMYNPYYPGARFSISVVI
jgi:hypothetical protein